MSRDNPWTAKDIENRFLEAISTLKKLPSENVQGYFNLWPAMKLTALEIIQQDVLPMRLLATPAAITRLDEVLTWLPWLAVDERRLVWQRASRVRWKNICWELGCDRSTAWRRWQTALEKIAASLNSRAR
jgi:hypothetical protein